MTVAVAFAQTTIALRDLLQSALRLDAGWRLTGGAPRITTLPHGKPDKGSGERLNLGLVAAGPGLELRNQPLPAPAEGAHLLAYDLRYLITVHVLLPLHAEILIGVALEALNMTPVLKVGPTTPNDDAFEASIMAGQGVVPGHSPHLTVEVAEARSFDILRVPALLVRVSPVVVAPPQPPQSILKPR